MRTYALRSKLTYWLFVFVGPCFFLIAGLFSTFVADGSPHWFALLWMLVCLGVSYRVVTMPYRIEVTDAGRIAFVGSLRTSTVDVSEVVSVKASASPFVEVKHARGKVLLLHQFDGFHEFLTELKRANPNVVTQGV